MACSLGIRINRTGWTVSSPFLLSKLIQEVQLNLLLLLAKGLASVTAEKTAAAFQVTESNPMVGLEGRTLLLVNLSKALSSNPEFFGQDARPGNIIGGDTLIVDPRDLRLLISDIRFPGEGVESV